IQIPKIRDAKSNFQIRLPNQLLKRFTRTHRIIAHLILIPNPLVSPLNSESSNLFPDLLDLKLSCNSFSDHLPAGVFNITNLRALDVSRNNFSDSFPVGVSNLCRLLCSMLSAITFSANYWRKSRSISSSRCLISPGATLVDRSLHNMDRSRTSSSFT
ncbi:hypothetical protein U1Q18_042897, partial [Sarracenia purpurea var. burkii]